MNDLTTRVTEIEFIPIKPMAGLIGFASFVLDEKYFVSSVAVYTRLDGSGLRIVYPSKKIGDKNIGIFYPIKNDVGAVIEKEVIEKVDKLFNEKIYEQSNGTENYSN